MIRSSDDDVFQPTWHLAKFKNLEDARSFAIEKGWRQNKVQIRWQSDIYYVEPYEGDCKCPNIIKPY